MGWVFFEIDSEEWEQTDVIFVLGSLLEDKGRGSGGNYRLGGPFVRINNTYIVFL